MNDHVLHIALLGGGLLLHQMLRSTWGYVSTVFGIGFKQGFVARLKAGRPLTREEKKQLDELIKQKLIDNLQKD